MTFGKKIKILFCFGDKYHTNRKKADEEGGQEMEGKGGGLPTTKVVYQMQKIIKYKS